MSANYLVVCPEKQEYFDPEVLTNCQQIHNFSMFPVMGMAFIILTHHCTNNDPNSPLGLFNSGRWKGKKIFTTGETHIGFDNTGNNKCGNLFVVAKSRYIDISLDLITDIKKYSQHESAIPAPEELPPQVPTTESNPSSNDTYEEYDTVRFKISWVGAVRTTIIQEKNSNGEWEDIKI
jgi:hypothetical protein